MGVLKYLDNVTAIISAIAAFASHRDPSRLAKAIARQIYEAVNESLSYDINGVVSKKRVLAAVESVVDAFEPLLGGEDNEEDDFGEDPEDIDDENFFG